MLSFYRNKDSGYISKERAARMQPSTQKKEREEIQAKRGWGTGKSNRRTKIGITYKCERQQGIRSKRCLIVNRNWTNNEVEEYIRDLALKEALEP